MQGLSGPQEAGAWRFRRLAIAAALIVLLFAVVYAQPCVPTDQAGRHSGLGLVGGSLAMAAAFWRRAGLTDGRRRRAWILFTITGLLAAVSNFLLISSAASPDPNRTPSDIASELDPRGGDRGTGHLPVGPPTDDRPGPNGPGRHRARRLGPVRRQRHRVPADSREHRRQQRVQPGGPGIRCRHRHRGDPAVPARRTAGPTHPGPVRRRVRLLRVLRLRLRACASASSGPSPSAPSPIWAGLRATPSSRWQPASPGQPRRRRTESGWSNRPRWWARS